MALKSTEPILTLTDCSVETGLSPFTLRHAVADGRLAAVHVAREVRVTPASLAKFQADRAPTPIKPRTGR